MTSDSPYLSVVMVSRNDDHGGNPLQRTQLCINSLFEQCNRFRLPVELIVVDWNPPPDRPGLAEIIQWPVDRRFIRTRLITVPPEFHRSLANSKNLPLFQMIGKNVGIRRARGEYVLATNIDILFSDELMEYLSKRPLKHGHSYRVDRFDVRPDVLTQHPENVLSYAQDHVLRVNLKLGTFFNPWVGKAGKVVSTFSDGIVYIVGNQFTLPVTSFFLNIPKNLIDGLHSLFSLMKKVSFIVSRIITNFLIAIFRIIAPTQQEKLKKILTFFINSGHTINNRCRAFLSLLRRGSRKKTERKNSVLLLLAFFLYRLKIFADHGLPFIHLNGCGDFTLLSKADWDRMGGYIEDPIFSWHVDSLFLIDSYYLGIREIYLPYPKTIFHVEHGTGSGWSPGKGEELLFERLERNKTPYFRWEDCLSHAKMWQKTQDKEVLPLQKKEKDYGFLMWDLPERVIE